METFYLFYALAGAAGSAVGYLYSQYRSDNEIAALKAENTKLKGAVEFTKDKLDALIKKQEASLSKKPAVKKPVAKKPTAKKASTKKPAAKKTTTRKRSTKK
tara:strand:- start:520 stop:825 length:306 start_codon:yes stop_codon:yes gene_type:complete